MTKPSVGYVVLKLGQAREVFPLAYFDRAEDAWGHAAHLTEADGDVGGWLWFTVAKVVRYSGDGE